MPTYEYECQKCKKVTEAFQSITAEPLKKCPKPRCGGRLKRLLGTGTGFIFKGSGFYITDNRSKSYQEAKKKEESAKNPAPATPTPPVSSPSPTKSTAKSKSQKKPSGSENA